jgi:hypothetical protein
MCLSFSFPFRSPFSFSFSFSFSFPYESITVFRKLRIVAIILFFFIIFYCNPSFSVLGPTILVGQETMLK